MTTMATGSRAEIIDNGYYTRVAAEVIVYGKYGVIALDMASLDDDGWQVRETYISRAGDDSYVLLAHGDGYNGYTIGDYCGGGHRSADVAAALGITTDALADVVEEIVGRHDIRLASTDWDMLDQLRENSRNGNGSGYG